jgi:hypothetical protein
MEPEEPEAGVLKEIEVPAIPVEVPVIPVEVPEIPVKVPEIPVEVPEAPEAGVLKEVEVPEIPEAEVRKEVEVPAEPAVVPEVPVAPKRPRPRPVPSQPAIVPLAAKRPRPVPATMRTQKVVALDPYYQSLTDSELLEAWDTTADFETRDKIVPVLESRKLFPSAAMAEWERDTGAYPDLRDPEFLQKLLAKREFLESLQQTWKPRTDPCEDSGTFEVTPVQRFISNFMSPKTPYRSALLYHGVGVGKTCSGVQISEAWLELFPRTPVYLVAPPTIKKGFLRTIFDIERVTIGKDNEPNTASQCTGDTYMRLSGTLYERDPEKIVRGVDRWVRRRYRLLGYRAFANYIIDLFKGIPKTLSEERIEEEKRRIIRREFSGRCLIIDEAHNLREVIEEGEEDASAFTGGKDEKGAATEGKILTPYLLQVLRYAEGLTLCLMTATPMYNTYREIVFMLNLLLLNDKKATLTSAMIFDAEGNVTEGGERLLTYTAQRYISFMRGENPLSFPVRLFPLGLSGISYPTLDPRGAPLDAEETAYYSRLPMAPILLQGDPLAATLAAMRQLPVAGKGLSTTQLDSIVNAGNLVVPAVGGAGGAGDFSGRTGSEAIWTVMNASTVGGKMRAQAKQGVGAQWLAADRLRGYSPKFSFFLERAVNAEGCIFVYTRFVGGGALPLALVLEANGYSAWSGDNILQDGIQAPGGRQCALCPRKEDGHVAADHEFAPAYYGIITGNVQISPDNEAVIRAQRGIENKDGRVIKVVIGSQVTSEGVDFRFVRETHVIDSWYHLNKTEQILGRAIRFLSHCALPPAKRNNTVYLYAAVLPAAAGAEAARETGDLYSYRVGFRKAVQVGQVTRILKQAAIDCNLNHDAIIIRDQDPVEQVDSQRRVRSAVDINDQPFTAVCDWIETCDYTCRPELDRKALVTDDTTYDEYSARWRVAQMKERLKALFARRVYYSSEDLWNLLSDIPHLAAVDLLQSVVGNETFQVVHQGTHGYIRYCNGYYMLQPNMYTDLQVPLAIRTAHFPVKRDAYLPIELEVEEWISPVEVDVLVTVEEFWGATVKWIDQLSRGDWTDSPTEIDHRRIDMAKQDQEHLRRFVMIFETIEWFHAAYRASVDPNSYAFRVAMLQYFWDEWLTLEEQRQLVARGGEGILECVQENQYRFGRTLINRYMDPKTGTVVFECEGGETCPPSYIEEIQADKEDPMQQFQVSRKTTGGLYAVLVPKYGGQLVMKTVAPPIAGGKVDKGKQCDIVSNMREHLLHLNRLGKVMEEAGRSDWGLTHVNLSNAVRLCTLTDLMLRVMDVEGVQGMRWFFRPVMAAYTGHKGTFREQLEKKRAGTAAAR